MSPALPGTRGLFSVLQHAISRGDSKRIRLNQHVYDTVADFKRLVHSLGTRPTPLQELVPRTAPLAMGASDACRRGMGDVWLDGAAAAPPLVWRSEFLPQISDALITFEIPATRSWSPISSWPRSWPIPTDIIAQARVVRERTLWVASDN